MAYSRVFICISNDRFDANFMYENISLGLFQHIGVLLRLFMPGQLLL